MIARVFDMLALRALSSAACLLMLMRYTGFFLIELSTDLPFIKLIVVLPTTGVRGSDAVMIPPIDDSMLY